MELSKAFSVQADYRDRRGPPSWDMFLFADVVFIDKTNSFSVAYVYQLNESSPDSNSLNFVINSSTSWKDSCTMLGELGELDKKKKLIHLDNKRVVSYKHLIVINGKKPLISTINHEITNALQTLMEALKVNPSVDSLLLPSWSLRQAPTNQAHASEMIPSDASQNVVKVTHPYFAEHDAQKNSVALDAINERLYEIYI